jgi:hypothetical protein
LLHHSTCISAPCSPSCLSVRLSLHLHLCSAHCNRSVPLLTDNPHTYTHLANALLGLCVAHACSRIAPAAQEPLGGVARTKVLLAACTKRGKAAAIRCISRPARNTRGWQHIIHLDHRVRASKQAAAGHRPTVTQLHTSSPHAASTNRTHGNVTTSCSLLVTQQWATMRPLSQPLLDRDRQCGAASGHRHTRTRMCTHHAARDEECQTLHSIWHIQA